MPHIPKDDKKKTIDTVLSFLTDMSPGEFNYVITKLAIDQATETPSYEKLRGVVGDMVCSVLEFYAQYVRKYEDKKILANKHNAYEGIFERLYPLPVHTPIQIPAADCGCLPNKLCPVHKGGITVSHGLTFQDIYDAEKKANETGDTLAYRPIFPTEAEKKPKCGRVHDAGCTDPYCGGCHEHCS